MSLRCSEISSRVGTKLGLATLAAEAVSASLIMLLMLAILFHLHPADWVCECCSTFRLVGLVMALLRGHTGHLMDWLATNLAYCTIRGCAVDLVNSLGINTLRAK
jgi:hypothetical protein